MIFLGLGSSIGDAKKIFASTEHALETCGIRVVKKSKIFKNPPVGGIAKNEFSNAVWQLDVGTRHALSLLKILQKIETDHGRTYEIKWGDRTLDLDILIFNDKIINTPNLKIPHPGIPKRLFVLKPLAELVDESFEIPTLGRLQDLLKKRTP